ncbi:MAG: PKD domain-containing protein, partial [Bacteroidetes bacterium]|nr:PKD domain-containing protein [Bacteroidota bacterium]
LQYITLGADTALCSNDLIQVFGASNIPLTYLWNTNNTNSSQIIHTAGQYWVQVTNANGCSNSDTIEVTISGEGPAVNTSIPSTTCVGTSIEFSAQGIISAPETIDSLVWNFGNGSTSSGGTVSTIYNSAGSKQIQLTVMASNGCEVVLNQSIQVFPNPNVTILAVGSCIYDTVSFSTQNNGFNIQNYLWDLGQNVTSASPIPNHVYNSSGTFPISVIASDQNGCIDSSSIQLTLTEDLENYSNTMSIIWPKADEVISDLTPLLSWNGVEGVSNYQVSLSMDSTFNTGVQQFLSSTASYQLTNNLTSGTWFWKVNSSLYGQNLVSNLGKFQIFIPTNIGSLKLWLRSDSVNILNGKVVQWLDLSMSNNPATQSTVDAQPNFIVNDSRINKPAIQFDGSSDFLTGTSIPNLNSNSISLFIVQSGDFHNGSIASGLFTINNESNGLTLYRRFFSNSHHLFLSNNGDYLFTPNGNLPQSGYNYKITGYRKKFGIQSELYLNNVSVANSTNSVMNGAFTNGNFVLGNSNYEKFKGNFAEILLYQTYLSNSDLNLVNNYLMDRYAPPVNLGEDITTIYQNNGFCVNETVTVSNIYTNYQWSTGATTNTIQVSQPGTYWVQTTDIFGRISRDTLVVKNPKMNIFNFQDTVLCFNEQYTITPTIPPDLSFVKWNNCNPNLDNEIKPGNAYFIEMVNSQGCLVKSDLFTVSVDSTLYNLSLGQDTSLCSGNNIQLQNAPAGITDYAWNTGNTQAIQAVDTSGQYVLEVTNTNNCQNRDTIMVTVIGTSPTLQFAFSDTLCQFSPGSFVDSSFVPNGNGIIDSISWFISNGDTLSGSSGSFSIDTSGTFNVTLLVQTQEGCSSSTTFPLVVHPKPVISFTTEKFCPYEAVEFTASNSQPSSLSSQLWSFDDNTTSTSLNPTHIFGTTDTYNVSLQAEDINGCRDTVVQAVYIQPAPVADFSFTNTCEQSAVNFVNESNIEDTFNIVTNAWTYGDGTGAINPLVPKIYEYADTFSVQLVVTANNGCQDTSVQSIIIYPKPILDWQIGPACKNTWTTFDNQSTITIGSIAETDWLVNLQYSLQGTSSAYKFVTTGVQYLNLTSTSDQGCTTDTLIIVNVQPEINAAYTVSPTTVVAGVPVVFTNNSTGGTSYEWNLGNGNIIQTTVAEPVEEMGFASSFIGDSILTYLAIQNAIGCKDTAYQYVKVNEPRIDLAINQLFVQNINGFYKVGVELRNLGFVEITQTDLLLKLYNSSPILETETESLAPGESRIYLFNANPSAFVSTQDNEISYLCVEATSYNDYQLIETELSNNISCLNTEGGNFVLLPIYPN